MEEIFTLILCKFIVIPNSSGVFLLILRNFKEKKQSKTSESNTFPKLTEMSFYQNFWASKGAFLFQKRFLKSQKPSFFFYG